jgi:hypothetical protein
MVSQCRQAHSLCESQYNDAWSASALLVTDEVHGRKATAVDSLAIKDGRPGAGLGLLVYLPVCGALVCLLRLNNQAFRQMPYWGDQKHWTWTGEELADPFSVNEALWRYIFCCTAMQDTTQVGPR